MRLLVDAQLPLRLAKALQALGHDVTHTTGLRNGNRTPDVDIARIADSEQRIVVTKDSDFLDSHQLSGTPNTLLLISTGNIRNDELIALFLARIDQLGDLLTPGTLVEMSRTSIVVHG